MGKYIPIIFIIFLIVFISIVLSLIFLINQKPQTKLKSSAEPIKIEGFYLNNTLLVNGSVIPFNNTKDVIVIGRLENLQNPILNNGKIIADLSFDIENNKKLEAKAVFFDSKKTFEFYVERLKTRNILLTSDSYTLERFKNTNDIINNLNPIQGKIIAINLALDSSDIKPNIPITKEYLECNNRFYEMLKNKIEGKLNCNIYVGQISVYAE